MAKLVPPVHKKSYLEDMFRPRFQNPIAHFIYTTLFANRGKDTTRQEGGLGVQRIDVYKKCPAGKDYDIRGEALYEKKIFRPTRLPVQIAIKTLLRLPRNGCVRCGRLIDGPGGFMGSYSKNQRTPL